MFIGAAELVSINNVKKTVSKKVVFMPDCNFLSLYSLPGLTCRGFNKLSIIPVYITFLDLVTD